MEDEMKQVKVNGEGLNSGHLFVAGSATFIWNICTSKAGQQNTGFKYGAWDWLLYFTTNKNKKMLQAPIKSCQGFPWQPQPTQSSL